MRPSELLGPVACCVLFASACSSPSETVPRGEGPAVCRAPSPGIGVARAGLPDTLLAVVAGPTLSDEQQRLLSLIVARPPSAEVHIARLGDSGASLLQADRVLVVQVSPTLSLAVRGTHLVTRAPADLSWSGAIGQHGVMQAVLLEKGITASIHNPPGAGDAFSYHVEPLGGGLHAMICIDETRFPPD